MPVNRRAIVTLIIIVVILGAVWALTSYQRARKTQELLIKLAASDELEAMDAMDQLRSRGRSIMPQLMEHLDSAQPRVRWRAALLIGEIGTRDPKVLSKLVSLCSDPQPVVQKAAMIACGRLGASDAASAIVKVVSDTKAAADVRASAAEALGMLKAQSAVKALAALLKEHPEVKPKEETTEEKSAKSGEAEEQKGAAETKEGEKSEEAAEEEQPDELWQARMEAAWALGQCIHGFRGRDLAEAVKDNIEPNVAVRTAAAYALADAIATTSNNDMRLKAIRAMLEALGDEAGDVRIAAAMSIARTYPPDSIKSDVEKALRAHIDDDHYWVRKAVKYAMEQLRISPEG